MGTVAVGTLIFMVAAAVPAAIDRKSAELAASPRLYVVNRTRPRRALPAHDCEVIRKIPGVSACTAVTGWNVKYGGQPVEAAAADDGIAEVFAESNLSPWQVASCRLNPACAIVGPLVAKRYGWRVGQRVSLQQNGAGLADGPPGFWKLDFVIGGVLKSTPYPNQFLLHRDYLEEAVKMRGWDDHDLADFIFVRVADSAHRDRVARHIDELFQASPYETSTQTERGVFQSALSVFGDVRDAAGMLSWLVLVNVIAVIMNSLAMSARDWADRDTFTKPPLLALAGRLSLEWLLTAVLGSILGIVLWFVPLANTKFETILSGTFGQILDFGDAARAMLVVSLLGLAASLVATWQFKHVFLTLKS